MPRGCIFNEMEENFAFNEIGMGITNDWNMICVKEGGVRYIYFLTFESISQGIPKTAPISRNTHLQPTKPE